MSDVYLSSVITLLIYSLGLVSIIIILFSIFLRVKAESRWDFIWIGLVFGLASSAAMLSPSEISEGLRIDGRYVVLILAGPFGGATAALISAAVAGLTRYALGGFGMVPGLVGIAIATATGIGYRIFGHNRRDTKGLLVLGLLAFLPTLGLLLLPFDVATSVLKVNGFGFFITNLIGIVMVGKFLCLEIDYKNHLRKVRSNLEIDALTQLGNRYLLEKIKYEGFNGQNDRPFSVIMLDVDHFKKVNDLYGHAAGDEVLIQFSAVISSMVRSSDYTIRYGGEEFIILLPDASIHDTKKIAEKIRIKVANHIFAVGHRELGITLSAGVSGCINGRDALDTAIKYADKALYMAKKNGRDRIETAAPSLSGWTA